VQSNGTDYPSHSLLPRAEPMSDEIDFKLIGDDLRAVIVTLQR
jgi:hypothetical protein